MHTKDLPVVILAAGMSTRFNQKLRTTHKSLLPIENNYCIFDFILDGLVQNGISSMKVLLGYKSEEFMKYFDNNIVLKNKNINLHPIIARSDYIRGPMYTLLSLISEMDEVIGNFVVFPSDTIFHPAILKQIFSCELKQPLNQCYMFTIQLSNSSLSKMNQSITFSPQIISKAFSSKFIPEIDALSGSKEYYLPILILSRSFLEFVSDLENQISSKIIKNVENFYKEKGNCHIFRLKYDFEIPPFLDIDTPYIYNTLNNIKKEFLEPYKVK